MPVPSAAPPAVRLMPSFERNDRRATVRSEPCADICCLGFPGLNTPQRMASYAAVPLTVKYNTTHTLLLGSVRVYRQHTDVLGGCALVYLMILIRKDCVLAGVK